MAARFSHASPQAAHSVSLDFCAPQPGHFVATLSQIEALASSPDNDTVALLILAGREPILPNATQTWQADPCFPLANHVFDSFAHRTLVLTRQDVFSFDRLFLVSLPVC